MNQKGFSPILLIILVLLVIALIVLIQNQKIFNFESSDIKNDTLIETQPINIDTESQKSRFPYVSDFAPFEYFEQQTPVNFECFDADNIPDNPKYSEIQEDLKNKGALEMICASPEFSEIFVQYKDKNLNEKSSIYNIYPKDDRDIPSPQVDDVVFPFTDFPFQEIKVNNWLSNNTLIITIFSKTASGDVGGANTYTLHPLHREGGLNPQLLEKCSTNRGIETLRCIKVTESGDSSFFQKNNLDFLDY